MLLILKNCRIFWRICSSFISRIQFQNILTTIVYRTKNFGWKNSNYRRSFKKIFTIGKIVYKFQKNCKKEISQRENNCVLKKKKEFKSALIMWNERHHRNFPDFMRIGIEEKKMKAWAHKIIGRALMVPIFFSSERVPLRWNGNYFRFSSIFQKERKISLKFFNFLTRKKIQFVIFYSSNKILKSRKFIFFSQ